MPPRARATPGRASIALDGETLRGSFDNFHDRAAARVLSAFAIDTAHVAAIIRVQRNVFTRNSKTGLLHHSAETAFYVSNTPLTAARAAVAIRGHWRIETTSHYSRDVTFGEDRSRIRTNPGVFVRLRSFAFNILSDRLRMVVAARGGMIQARDVDPRDPWPDGRHCPQDQAVSD